MALCNVHIHRTAAATSGARSFLLRMGEKPRLLLRACRTVWCRVALSRHLRAVDRAGERSAVRENWFAASGAARTAVA